MTREQFVRGYLLLTSQPWGKAYRSLVAYTDGEPSPAEIQLEFYYSKLSASRPESWLHACEVHATGDHWPSIEALKLTIRQHIPKHIERTALPAPPVKPIETCSMEEALADKPELLHILKRVMS